MTKKQGGNPHIAPIRAKDAATICIEMHCKGASKEHTYGSPTCSWALRMGTVVAKSDLSGWKNRPTN